MRGSSGLSAPAPQGLTQLWRKQMNLKLRQPREITERRQVGDAESMINEGTSASGHQGLFKGEGGEV